MNRRAAHDGSCAARSGGGLRHSPRALRNWLVYSSGDVLEMELQVGDAYVSVQGVSRSNDQKCSPARPLLTAYDVSVFTSAVVKVSLVLSFRPIIGVTAILPAGIP